MTGIGTSDVLLEIAVPAGPTHDVWIDGINGVRIMQPAANTDFELQTKLQSQFTTGYQQQGFIVEQSAGTLLRYDTFYDGVKRYVYSATLSGRPLTNAEFELSRMCRRFGWPSGGSATHGHCSIRQTGPAGPRTRASTGRQRSARSACMAGTGPAGRPPRSPPNLTTS